MITYLGILLVLTNIVFAEHNFYTQGRYGKREESHSSAVSLPFFSGSRYGRSGSNTGRPAKEEPKTVEISPRVDRFFLGSRYGKRLPSGHGESTDGSHLASHKRLQAALSYLNRARRSDQHRSNENYEIEQIYYDNGYNDGNDGNYEEQRVDGAPCQFSDNSDCSFQA